MTNKPEIKPCVDAVEALAKSIAHTEWEYASPNPTSVIEHLATQGYTITRAEPAAPSSDEVEKALAKAARNLGWLEALPPYGDKDTRKAAADEMCSALTELRAHIAALEAELALHKKEIFVFGEDGSIRSLNYDKLEAENKRLREALEKLEMYADDSDDAQYGTLSTSLVRDIAKSALAQTDGNEGE